MKPLVVKTVKKKVTEKQVADIQEEKEVMITKLNKIVYTYITIYL